MISFLSCIHWRDKGKLVIFYWTTRYEESLLFDWDCKWLLCYHMASKQHERESSRAIFRKTVKKYGTLKQLYRNKKNIYRVLELYECLSTLQRWEMFVHAYKSALHGILNELEVHQSKITNLRLQGSTVKISSFPSFSDV